MTAQAISIAGATLNLGEIDADDLSIDPTTIDRALARHSGTWVWWAHQAEKLRVKREGLEAELKRMEGELYLSLRGQQGPDGKPLTETGIRSLILADERYLGKQAEILATSHEEREAGIVKDAVHVRRECLLAIAANQRAERTLPATPVEDVSPAVEKRREQRTKVGKGV